MTAPRRLIDGAVAFLAAGPVGAGATLPRPDPCRPAHPVQLPALQGDPKQLRERAENVVAVALLDCSGSEYAADGDREMFRMAAMRSLARLMRRTGGGAMHVVHWGSRPVHALGPADVGSAFKTLDQALLRDPGPMGGNDFAAAAEMARQLLADARQDTVGLVFGVTDGLEPITNRMRDAVHGLLPARVHMLMVPGDNCPDALAQQWAALPIATFTRLPSDNRAMAHAVGTVYADAVGGRLPDPSARVPRARTLHGLLSTGR